MVRHAWISALAVTWVVAGCGSDGGRADVRDADELADVDTDDADDGYDPSCHYDCFEHELSCVRGTVYRSISAPIPCWAMEGESPATGVGWCEHFGASVVCTSDRCDGAMCDEDRAFLDARLSAAAEFEPCRFALEDDGRFRFRDEGGATLFDITAIGGASEPTDGTSHTRQFTLQADSVDLGALAGPSELETVTLHRTYAGFHDSEGFIWCAGALIAERSDGATIAITWQPDHRCSPVFAPTGDALCGVEVTPP